MGSIYNAMDSEIDILFKMKYKSLTRRAYLDFAKRSTKHTQQSVGSDVFLVLKINDHVGMSQNVLFYLIKLNVLFFYFIVKTTNKTIYILLEKKNYKRDY